MSANDIGTSMSGTAIAIIGAGPIGLEAALAALARGYAVEIFERGAVAEAVREWGHVGMFSPFGMNATTRALAQLQAAGATLPGPEELLTGAEFRTRYLAPLARTLPPGVLHENTTVVALGRSRILKGDHIGAPTRNATPFRLLLQTGDQERIVHADAVLDCSGTYGQPNRLGDGGIPVPGERVCADHIHHGIPDLAGAARAQFDRRRVLVVGAGHSAATVICQLAALHPETEIHWLLRRDRELPGEEVAEDPLPARARLVAAANRLVREDRVTLHRTASVEAIAPQEGALAVVLTSSTGSCTITVDELVAATGFRPDLMLTRELQVQTCWATEGTYPLAASLLGEAGADCLQTPAFGAEMLMHPEPGFFTLGMKSYGRSPNFLLRTGYEQVEMVLDWMDAQRPSRSRSRSVAG
ncbi:MAG: NAD(P)-binding domain-containing protein [Chthoniobacterales bacterium]